MKHNGILKGSRTSAIAFAVVLLVSSPGSAQVAGTANLGGEPMVSTPIPDGDFSAVAKRLFPAQWDPKLGIHVT